MIRKFNYTGRQKIKRSNIEISVHEEGHQRNFDANIEFDSLAVPLNATVYIEPYFQLYSMRFNCGTVERFILPTETLLSDMPYSNLIYFRVKIVDESGRNGLLLAYADKLKPSGLDEVTNNRQSILPVEFSTDLGQQVWKLFFTGSSPVLHINRRIENRKDLIRSEEFISLAYPSIIREIMTRIVYNFPEYDEEGDHWSCQWLQFAYRTLHVYEKPESTEDSEEDMIEWVDSVVEAFCRKNVIMNLYNSSILAK
jgi:hypothetical protein